MSFVGEGMNIVIPKKRSSTNKGLKSKSNAREGHHHQQQQQQQEIVGGGKVVVKEEKTTLATTTTTSITGSGNYTKDGLGDVMNMGWEEWPCWWNVMEEQMIWGCVMVPGWEEMDFKGGLCGHNEVVWEDDLWCLRDIKHPPY
ncbi:hypothetical protein Sjap_024452 [Stephania japonica]|uniref:Uncharacterized protein n=1 Tax=Stephania japonica TaxID=461633 RepID=A0AAP0HQ53_9MAGN